jgi:ATP-dependent DNA helicase RecG
MSLDRVIQLLQVKKEGLRLEFKKASSALPSNLFDSICAMLNRDGGDILLGVDDDGTILGVSETVYHSLMVDISNLSNNPQKLNPPFILHPTFHVVDDKVIIHIQVPASSQIHETNGNVYDRSSDGDFKAKQPHQIAALHNHKRSFYSESIIYPYIQVSDFNPALFPKVRNLISSYKPNHPWLSLDDEQLLKTAGLWRKDFQTSQEGYTLAAVLLFGKDEVIQQVLPHYKIDALVRIVDTNRFDDRLYIQTNLIDAYDLLMGFIEKHLPDKFYLNGDQRISLRTLIFREIVANLIVHREYTNAQPCSLVIYKDKVICTNANNSHGEGPIDPKNFAPHPKNPALAKFFIQLGRVDELGSGVLNVYRLVKEYGGKGQPLFVEGSTFS